MECLELAIHGDQHFRTNCYLLPAGDQLLWVVDPADDWPRLAEALAGHEVAGIICTHRHFDHISALAALHNSSGALVYAGREDAAEIWKNWQRQARNHNFPEPCLEQLHRLQDGDSLSIGDRRWLVLETPGHSSGSICLYDPAGAQLISGDTLFYQAFGRTDLKSGDEKQMWQSLRRLAQLPANVTVYPGHDASTSIGQELEDGALQNFGPR
ncbi:MAG: MBL fold metallo-hydrolase [Actinomycetia bacterium]|nr:MBL fold metallo-hydrolase [Actinomycetes bacterium]